MKLIKFVFKILVVLFVVVILVGVFIGDEEVVAKESEAKKNTILTSVNCTEYGPIENCSIDEVMSLNLKLSEKIVKCKELYGAVNYKKKCKSTVELSDLASQKMTFLMNEIAKIPEDAAAKAYEKKYGEWKK